MHLARALIGAMTVVLATPLARAGVVDIYPPYSHLVESNVSTVAFGVGDGFLLHTDWAASFDGTLRWSMSFTTAPEVRFVTGDATFAVQADGVRDGMGDASIALYRSTFDDVAQGKPGERVHRFDVEVPDGGSWAHAVLDANIAPLPSGSLYSLVFEGESVGNPYLQARMDFTARLPATHPPAVPEPGTMLLFVAGASALLLVRRRSRS